MAVHENWHCKHLISQFNLQRGEGQILSLYHSTTGTTLTFVPFCHTWSYLTLRVFYFLYFWFILMHWPYFRVGYLTIIIVLFADPVSMNYVLGLLKRFLIVYCALWQMIQPPSWSKFAAKFCLCYVAKIYWVRLTKLRINTSLRNTDIYFRQKTVLRRTESETFIISVTQTLSWVSVVMRYEVWGSRGRKCNNWFICTCCLFLRSGRNLQTMYPRIMMHR